MLLWNTEQVATQLSALLISVQNNAKISLHFNDGDTCSLSHCGVLSHYRRYQSCRCALLHDITKKVKTLHAIQPCILQRCSRIVREQRSSPRDLKIVQELYCHEFMYNKPGRHDQQCSDLISIAITLSKSLSNYSTIQSLPQTPSTVQSFNHHRKCIHLIPLIPIQNDSCSRSPLLLPTLSLPIISTHQQQIPTPMRPLPTKRHCIAHRRPQPYPSLRVSSMSSPIIILGLRAQYSTYSTTLPRSLPRRLLLDLRSTFPQFRY